MRLNIKKDGELFILITIMINCIIFLYDYMASSTGLLYWLYNNFNLYWQAYLLFVTIPTAAIISIMVLFIIKKRKKNGLYLG